ncbi:aerotolerance protein [Pontibacter sp. E15-1]|uniref:aerotolerance protein n=1 Tax=Pontibacter sp. E15-1 TaxID=2919918 RepID=UPI001F500033|nr:aerotolerance protein [Pontibacter sp. E15-1]MCJ8164598.1 aerotolerance protein [Pontibacter sp. E15-1]
MKLVFLLVFLISFFGAGLNTISRVNEYARQGAAAFQRQEYTEAIVAYNYLVHELGVQDDQLQLNLAHAYYKANMWPQAQDEYRVLASHPSHHLRAVAHLQLGNIAVKYKKYAQALPLYKAALIAEPENDAARYNYELLKKYVALHPQAQEDSDREQLPDNPENPAPDSLTTPPPAAEALEPQPRKKPDAGGNLEEETDKPQEDRNGQQEQRTGTSPKENADGEKEREQQSGTEAGDVEGLNPAGQADAPQQQRGRSAENAAADDPLAQTRRTRLQQMNMSPEKARLLLDAMRNAELQYIQQLPKKASKKPDTAKPDW